MDELKIAISAAQKAGQIIRNYYDQAYVVEEKAVGHPVTVADRFADAIIKKVILSSYPDDGWLSEETKDNPDRLKKERVWIVDPLDGTKEFIQKIPEFAVSIALCENGLPIIGVIYNPLTEEMFTAQKGKGAFLNGAPIQVSDQKELSQAIILASRSEIKRGEWKPFEEKFILQESGGMAHKMAMVAYGDADGSFSLTPKTEWDFCAGVLLIEEAGGKVSQVDGKKFVFNKPNPRATGIVYGNSFVYDELMKLI